MPFCAYYLHVSYKMCHLKYVPVKLNFHSFFSEMGFYKLMPIVAILY